MKNYQIKINQFISPAYELFLFNRPEHAKLQKAEDSFLFQLVSDNRSYVDFLFFISGKEAYSPFQAPFGSIQFSPEINIDTLDFFVDEVLAFTGKNKIDKLKIVNYPDCYSSASDKLNRLLISKGFQTTITELNFHLSITGTYESHLHTSELRRLKKCENAGFQLKAGKEEHLYEMYDQIRSTRNRKGFPLSMELEALQKSFIQFPEDYYSFTLWNHTELIASSIGVRVSSEILYYFLPGDNEKYKNYSPAVQLIKGMYEFCQSGNYKILDLGISTSGGIRNEGLIRFKENLGGIASNKNTYVKEFSV